MNSEVATTAAAEVEQVVPPEGGISAEQSRPTQLLRLRLQNNEKEDQVARRQWFLVWNGVEALFQPYAYQSNLG